MPLYEYKCLKCGAVFMEIKPISDYLNGPICCEEQTQQVLSAAHITPDIKEYLTVAADKETGKRVRIGSRSAHREFLKKNNYEELGNDNPFSKN